MLETVNRLKMNKATIFALSLLAGFILLSFSDLSFAGGEGEEFDDVWDTLVGWTQGTLGRIIALALIVVGAVMGVVRQSLMAFAIGLAMGLGLYNSPMIIEKIMGATISHPEMASNLIQSAVTISNGLGI